MLSGPLAKSATIVSLDLPGYGGSDGLSRYSATEVLNAVSEAIIELKKRYTSSSTDNNVAKSARCVLVGHDWGGLITYRVAAEAPGLVDRVVVLNSAYVGGFQFVPYNDSTNGALATTYGVRDQGERSKGKAESILEGLLTSRRLESSICCLEATH